MRSLKYIIPAVLLAAVIGWQQLKAMIVAEGPLQEVVNVVIPKGAGTKLVAQELKKRELSGTSCCFGLQLV